MPRNWKKEARKTEDVMGDCVKRDLEEWEENGEQQQKIGVGDS